MAAHNMAVHNRSWGYYDNELRLSAADSSGWSLPRATLKHSPEVSSSGSHRLLFAARQGSHVQTPLTAAPTTMESPWENRPLLSLL